MAAAGFDPAISVSERPQTHALNSAATGIGGTGIKSLIFSVFFMQKMSETL
jgi:hypothetical protein